MSEKCALCDLYLTSDVVTVKKKGLQTLINASQAREDNKNALFEDKLEIRLHRKCRLMYIEEKCIAAYKKRNQSNESNVSFDSEKCIFCNENADLEFVKSQQKYPADKRIRVYQVSKLDTQKTILKSADTHNDDWSQRVLRRIENVNLLEVKAVYHCHCYSKFCHPYRTAGLKRGRQLSLENAKAMELIYSFLEKTDADVCQLSLPDIRNAFPDVELPSDQVIEYNLKLHYSNKLTGSQQDNQTTGSSRKKRCNSEGESDIPEFLKVLNDEASTSNTLPDDASLDGDSDIPEVLKVVKNEASTSNTLRDDASLFGEYVASKLRKMDPIITSIVQHHMQNIIYKAEMGGFSQMADPIAVFPGCSTTSRLDNTRFSTSSSDDTDT